MHHHLNKIVWHELKLEYFQVTVGLQTWHYKTRSLQRELNATNLNWHSSEWTECSLLELVENVTSSKLYVVFTALVIVVLSKCAVKGDSENGVISQFLVRHSLHFAVVNSWIPASPWIVAPRRNTFTCLSTEKTNTSCARGTGAHFFHFFQTQ